MNLEQLIENIERSEPFSLFLKSKKKRIAINGITGSMLSLVLTAAIKQKKGVHIIVMDSKDAAGYLYWDLYNFVQESEILFFPTGYARSIIYGREDSSGIVQRTAVVSALKNHKKGDTLIICTYPEALSEKVATSSELNDNSFVIESGTKIKRQSIIDKLMEFGFAKVDFVFEPGQFSLRGGIIDIFSFSNNRPYRIDMFGDDVESIKLFDVNSQRSTDECRQVDIIANLKKSAVAGKDMISLSGFVDSVAGKGETFYWIDSPVWLMKKITELKTKFLKNSAENGADLDSIKGYITGVREFTEHLSDAHIYSVRDEFKEMPAEKSVKFSVTPQPAFNKNFELLASSLKSNIEKGYRNYILTENKAQIERLENIFYSIGTKERVFDTIPISLHEGFTDNDTKCCFYTDHQIFERHHRYKIVNELPKSEAMSVSELNALRAGDYIVHIDHGVGRFAGLMRSEENGKVIESIKLIYKDGDVLLVNVHSLHKISKYKDAESGDIVKVHKLGSGAWQKLKLTTKTKVKDIAKDLIKLYAERKASKGFAFSKDTYLQNELEASFIYEDTPDQQKATLDFKADMEISQPMDRLVCGDVGFGKTEIAMRAAFKAVTDGKQVAVLVPTTVLSLQHYRTFTRRLKDFPVTIENLSRVKSAKQTNEICEKLKNGKIDILIGTHKILGKGVEFCDLGLLVVDEEQKFGVASKEKLRQLKHSVDTLTLSATPIPRTLQFSLMGARDLSIINTPPPNRQSIDTIVHEFNNDLIKDAITEEILRGGQVFFIHNRVQTIEHIASLIRSLVPEARVTVGHGQMPADKLEKVMMDFIYGEYDVFVATTIMESGIDIPNANTIIINDAQNFGLSDLHQLRGRVGRSNKKAYCYLLVPSGEVISDTGRRRLRVIEDYSDLGSGFNIAMQDLDIRGAGNMLGGEQSGFIADIGFETYQKIVSEAMIELSEENYSAAKSTGEHSEGNEGYKKDDILCGYKYVNDCQVDIDVEAHIPDSYVSQTNEKIRLYRLIDSLENKKQLDETVEMLNDRFGEVPYPTKELLNIVLLRKTAISLGFEKAIVKNGYFILHFVSNKSSAYYDTPLFKKVMEVIGEMGHDFKLKHLPTKLILSIRSVRDIAAALKIITEISEKVSVTE